MVTAHDSPPKPSCIIWHLRRTLDENLINVEGIDLRLSSIQITPIVRESIALALSKVSRNTVGFVIKQAQFFK